MSDENRAAAIRFIEAIVNSVLQETKIARITAALKQIFILWNYIPEDLRRKCYFVFDKLWKKNLVVLSTKPEMPGVIYEVEFYDEQLKKIYFSVSEKDASAIRLGVSMRELISRGLHSDSDDIKQDAHDCYKERGLSIVNLITTNDISFLFDDVADLIEKEKIKEKFDWWVENYTNISILVSPEQLQNIPELESKILTAAKSLAKTYILINFTGKMNEIQNLIQIIEKLKTGKKLCFKEFRKYEIKQSGFCTAFKGQIIF